MPQMPHMIEYQNKLQELPKKAATVFSRAVGKEKHNHPTTNVG